MPSKEEILKQLIKMAAEGQWHAFPFEKTMPSQEPEKRKVRTKWTTYNAKGEVEGVRFEGHECTTREDEFFVNKVAPSKDNHRLTHCCRGATLCTFEDRDGDGVHELVSVEALP